MSLWRKDSWRLAIILLCCFLFSNVSAISIYEVMPHTNNSQQGEWVELRNPENTSIEFIGKISDKVSNDSITLNISAFSFGIITNVNCSLFNISNESCVKLSTIGNGLNDDEETIYLYENESLIDSFSWNKSIKSSGNSWQLYQGSWKACIPTPAAENFCSVNPEPPQPPQNGNDSEQNVTLNSTVIKSFPKIFLDLHYNDATSKEFKVKVFAYNLLDYKYDIKVYIEKGKILSQIYDKDAEKWKSGNYFINEVFMGPGNNSKELKLRIKEDFSGKADIIAKIRKSGTSSSIYRFEDKIDIEIKNEEENKESSKESSNSKILGKTIASEETGKDIKTQNLYKSKNERIKEYAIFGFSIFCTLVLILLVLKRKYDKGHSNN